MKKATCPSFRSNSLRFILAALGLACALPANNAGAASSAYFTTSVVSGGTYSWDAANWSVSGGTSSGPFASPWTAGDFARFYGGAGDTYTVTVNAAESMAGILQDAAGTLIINDAGNNTGSLSIVPNSTQDGFGPCQGFYENTGGNLIINCPIIGTGGLEQELFSGTPCNLLLFGTNTYSGGTLFTSSSVPVFFDNNASFGTGPLGFYETTFANLIATNPVSPTGYTITIPNSITNLGSALGVNFASVHNFPVVLSGPWNLQGFALNLRNNGDTTASLTLAGVVSGTAGITFSGANLGTIILSAHNTFSGGTTLTLDGTGITLQLGNTYALGSGASTVQAGSVLDLHGTTGVTNTINLNGTGISSAGALINSSGTAASLSGGTVALATASSIGGSGNITINEPITGGVTLTKMGAGTLEIGASASLAGNLTVNAGGLKLDSATALATPTTVIVTLASGLAAGSVNLNFSGVQNVNTLYTNGVIVTGTGTYGSPSSTAANKNPLFTGSGVLNVGGAPVITAEPQSLSVWQGSNAMFAVTATGATSYQWKYDGASIGGANTASYTVNAATLANAGPYACAISNAVPSGVLSSNAYLTVRTTNAYTAIVMSDSPLAYWRLDETNGTTAFDATTNNNKGAYVNVVLNQKPGYSTVDSNDPCVYEPAVGSFVDNAGVFDFFTNASPQFTFEAWAKFTNITSGVQRLFSCFYLEQYPTNCGYAFGIADQNTMEFSTLGGADYKQAIGSPLQNNVWYQLALGYDGTYFHFYVNGQPLAPLLHTNSTGVSPAQEGTELTPMTLGADNDAGLPNLHEQFLGLLDECSIYGTFLGDTEVSNHYAAALPSVPIVTTPVADFPTNYISLTTTFEENAVGQSLQYQWYSIIAGVTNMVGGNSNTLVLSGLTLGSAGSYYCNVSNTGGSTNTPTATLTVLPIPTTAAQVGLTNGLVLHLPFDGNYNDISGYHNNGSPVGSPTLNTDIPIVGSGYLSFGTSPGATNYVTLGTPAKLLFSNNLSFSVAFWVNQPTADVGTNLPFFCNTLGSYGTADGYCFAPYLIGGSGDGGWDWSAGDGIHTIADNGTPSSIGSGGYGTSGGWHHLVFVFARGANETTYLDGQYASSQPIAAITNFDTTNVFNIGQDASGVYGSNTTTSGYMDDLGVWARTLSAFEVSGMFLAGISNNVSFAPVVTLAPPATPVTISNMIGSTITYGGGSGSRFILMSTNTITLPGSRVGWAPVTTNATTPGTFTVPLTNSSVFYYIQSQ